MPLEVVGTPLSRGLQTHTKPALAEYEEYVGVAQTATEAPSHTQMLCKTELRSALQGFTHVSPKHALGGLTPNDSAWRRPQAPCPYLHPDTYHLTCSSAGRGEGGGDSVVWQ